MTNIKTTMCLLLRLIPIKRRHSYTGRLPIVISQLVTILVLLNGQQRDNALGSCIFNAGVHARTCCGLGLFIGEMLASVLALVSTHAQRPRLHSLCIRIAHSERPLCPAAFDLAVTRANGPSALMRQLSKRRHPTPNVADRFVLDSDDRTGNAADQLTRQRLLCRLVVATRSPSTPMQQYAAIGDCVRLL